jgi:hypothetical protein
MCRRARLHDVQAQRTCMHLVCAWDALKLHPRARGLLASAIVLGCLGCLVRPLWQQCALMMMMTTH